MAHDPQARHAQLAARLDADVGAQHVAAVYAEGLLNATEQAGQTEAMLAEFDAFLGDVLDVFPDFESILSSRLVMPEEKEGLLDRAVGSQASPMFLNFLKVVAHHQRLDLLRAIRRQAQQRLGKIRGRVPVQLATATPIDGPFADRIAQSLAPLLGGSPELEQVVDPKLIGGIVVRVGDKVYDGSIANQLHILRQQMMDRSAHEIQSRRDRFRSPT
jgi:F-type H+-transporting ATPase subunit delta